MSWAVPAAAGGRRLGLAVALHRILEGLTRMPVAARAVALNTGVIRPSSAMLAGEHLTGDLWGSDSWVSDDARPKVRT